MKNELLLIFILLSLSFTNTLNLNKISTAPEFGSDVLDFIKTNDKGELIKILNLVQNEHNKLSSNKESHLMMCEKSLHSCKVKFTNKMCDIHNEYRQKEFESNLKENEETAKESISMTNKISVLIKQNKDDCKNLSDIYFQNENKFKNDIKLVADLIQEVKQKIVVVKEKEEERIREEKRKQEEALKKEREKIEENLKQMKEVEKNIKKEREEVEKSLNKLKSMTNITGVLNKNHTNITLTHSLNISSIPNKVTNKTQTVIHKIISTTNNTINKVKNVTITNKVVPVKNTTTTSKINITSNSKKLNTYFIDQIKRHQNQNFVQLETKMEAQPKNNLFQRMFVNFAQMAQGLSFIQLEPPHMRAQTDIARSALLQIDKKIKHLKDFMEEIQNLLRTNKDLNAILENLLQAKKELYDSYHKSSQMCEKRLTDLKAKKEEFKKLNVKSKLEVENLKSKFKYNFYFLL
jgi:hypothetical protein